MPYPTHMHGHRIITDAYLSIIIIWVHIYFYLVYIYYRHIDICTGRGEGSNASCCSTHICDGRARRTFMTHLSVGRSLMTVEQIMGNNYESIM